MKNHILSSFFLVCLFALTGLRSFGQQVLQQFQVSASKAIQITCSTSDPDGNTLIGGYFYGNQADLHGFTLNAIHFTTGPTLSVTAFVAKLNPAGTVLWAKAIHSNKVYSISTFNMFPSAGGYQNEVQRIVTAPNGDIYVGGNTGADTLTINGLNPVLIPNPPFSMLGEYPRNLFLLKLDPAGNPGWCSVLMGGVVVNSDPMRLHHLIFSQGTLRCLVQGNVHTTVPSFAFTFSATQGARMLTINPSSGVVVGEIVTYPYPFFDAPTYMASWPLSLASGGAEEYIPLIRVEPTGTGGSWGNASVQKFVNGQLDGEEKLGGSPWLWSCAFATVRDLAGNYYVSHGVSWAATGLPDSVNVLQAVLRNSGDWTGYLFTKINADGCLLWSKVVNGPVYNLTLDQSGNLYGLLCDTIGGSSQWSPRYMRTSSYSFPYDFNQSSSYKLIKINPKGSIVLQVQVPSVSFVDSVYAWDHYYGNEFYTPQPLASISRIKNDSITITGHKGFCIIKDNTVDSVFINNPVTCDPKDLFRPVVTSVREPKPQQRFSLYPNPADAWITLEAMSPIQTIEITNAVGRLVSVDGGPLQNGKRLNISSLSPGLYSVKIQTKEGAAVQKVVKK